MKVVSDKLNISEHLDSSSVRRYPPFKSIQQRYSAFGLVDVYNTSGAQAGVDFPPI